MALARERIPVSNLAKGVMEESRTTRCVSIRCVYTSSGLKHLHTHSVASNLFWEHVIREGVTPVLGPSLDLGKQSIRCEFYLVLYYSCITRLVYSSVYVFFYHAWFGAFMWADIRGWTLEGPTA